MSESPLDAEQQARLYVVERLMAYRRSTGFAASSPALDNGYLTYVAGWIVNGERDDEPDEEETEEESDEVVVVVDDPDATIQIPAYVDEPR